MYQVNILPAAKLDISDAANWYNSKQQDLGKQFVKEIRNKTLLIVHNPKIYPVRYKNIRTTVLDVFPFMIHYTFDESNKTILIVGVFHTSLNPDRWSYCGGDENWLWAIRQINAVGYGMRVAVMIIWFR